MKRFSTFVLVMTIFFIITAQDIFSQTDNTAMIYVYAKKLYDDRMYDLAAEQFHQFGENNPDHPKAAEALLFAGLSYFNIKEYKKAQKEFLFLIIRFPNARELDQAQYKVAECFQSEGDVLAAANAYRQVQIFYPKSSWAESALFMAARMFFQGKDYETTVEVLYEFLEVYPSSLKYQEAQLLLVDSFIEVKNFDRAQLELEKVLNTAEPGKLHAQAMLKKAHLVYSMNFFQQAENEYTRLIDTYTQPKFRKDTEIMNILDEAYYLQGDLYRKKGLFDKSNASLSKISNSQADMKTLSLMAENYFSNRNYAQAADLYHKIISMSDSTYLISSCFKLANSYQALNDDVNAARFYDQVLQLCNTKKDHFNQELCRRSNFKISEIYLNLNQAGLAISHLKKYRVTADDDKNLDAIDFRIAYLYETKNYDLERAIRAYYDFIDNYPQSNLIDEAQFGLARCYERKEEYNQALIEYHQVLKHYPASRYFFDAKQRIDYITNYYPVSSTTLQNFGSIIQHLTEKEADITALYQLGLLYFKELKDYTSSISLFKKCFSLEARKNISKDELWYYLGRSYQLLSEKEYIDENKKSADWDSTNYYYQILIENFPQSPWADDVAYHQTELKKIDLDKSDPTYFQQIREALNVFRYHYSESSYLDKVNFELGVFLLNNGPKSSIDSLDIYNSFENIIKHFPQSPWKSGADFYQALLFYEMKNLSLAETRLRSFISEYPNSQYSCKAYFLLAKLSEIKQDLPGALNFLQLISTNFYYSDYADSAQLMIGSLFIKQEKYADAISYLLRMYEGYESTEELISDLGDIRHEALVQEVLFKLANAYHSSNDKRQAAYFYQKYLAKFPRGRYLDQVLFALGELFTALKPEERLRAIDYFQQLETEIPQSNLIPAAMLKLGDLFFKNEQYQMAHDYYLKSLNYQLNEDNKSYALAQILISLYRLGQLKVADERYKAYERQYKEKKSQLAEVLLEKGTYLLNEKDFAQAEKIFKAVQSEFKKFPAGAKAEFLLGKMYFILNKEEEALELIADLIEKKPVASILPEVYITLGNFYYLKARQIENALLAYKSAIESPNIDDHNLQLAMSNVIKCSADLQLFDQAISFSRQYLDKFPTVEDAFEKKIQLGYYYYRLKDYDYALQFFKKLKPEADLENEPRLQYWIGECYFEKGQFQQAISEYLKIAYLSRPTKLLSQYRVTAQYQAGIAYIKIGKYENARQLFQKIVIEQGAESVFGKPAKEKLSEIDRLTTEPN